MQPVSIALTTDIRGVERGLSVTRKHFEDTFNAASRFSDFFSKRMENGVGEAVKSVAQELWRLRSIIGTPHFALGIVAATGGLAALAAGTAPVLIAFKTLAKLVEGMQPLDKMLSVIPFKEVQMAIVGIDRAWNQVNMKIDLVRQSLDVVIERQQYIGRSLSGRQVLGPTLADMWDEGTGVQLFAALEEYQNRLVAIRSQSGDTEKEIENLNKTIKDHSLATKTVRLDLAMMVNELVNVGLSSQEINNSIESVNLTMMSTGESARTIATGLQRVISGFGVSSEEMSRAADVMAKASLNSGMTFNDLATALQRVGPIAVRTNQSMEDMTVSLTLLNGVGDTTRYSASTLATMLLSLEAAVTSNSESLHKLGLGFGELTTGDGGLKALPEIITSIRNAVSDLEADGLSKADTQGLLEDILGTPEQSEVMLKLISKTGDEIFNLSNKVGDATSFNQNYFNAVNKGVNDSLHDLQYRLAEVSTLIGDTYAPYMTYATTTTEYFLNKFLELPPALQQAIIEWGILFSVLKLAISWAKLGVYAMRAKTVAIQLYTFATQENATAIAALKIKELGKMIQDKAVAAQTAVNTRLSAILTGTYTKQALVSDLVATKTGAMRIANAAFMASQETSIKVATLAYKALSSGLTVAYGALLLFQGATERSEGAKQAIKLKEATESLTLSYREISGELDKLEDEYKRFWESIGDSAISTFERIQKQGLVSGTRDSLALFFEESTKREQKEIDRIYAETGRKVRPTIEISPYTDTSSDYGNQKGFSLTSQLGNQRYIIQLAETQRQLEESFQDGIRLRSRKNISDEDFIAKSRPLIDLYDKQIQALKELKPTTEASTLATQNHIKSIDGNRDALLKRLYAIEKGIDLNTSYALSVDNISNSLNTERDGITKNIKELQASLTEAVSRGDLTSGEMTSQLMDAEISSMEEKIVLYKEKIEELNAVSINLSAEETDKIRKLQKELTIDLINERKELAEARIKLGEMEVEEIAGQFDEQSNDLEFFHQRAIVNTKKALSARKIDIAEFNDYLMKFEETKLKERQRILNEEFNLLDKSLKEGKISIEQYEKRNKELLKESLDLMNAAADMEIARQKEVAKAYEEKLSVMSLEISLQESINNIALLDAEASGASEIELNNMKISQLEEIQEMKRQELELQLAKNLASAEDVGLQQQLNDLILKRFEVDASKELKQAQFQVQDAQVQEQEAQKSEWLQRIQDSANAKSEMIGMEAESLEVINELRSQEIELIDRAKESLQLKHDAIAAEEEAIIASLERQKSLADELLQLQAETGEEAALMKDELEAQLGLGTYTDYFGKTYKKKGDASEVEILERKYEIEKQIAEAKEAQLVRQHELQSQLLDMETQQNLLNAEQAIQEAEINELKASQAIIEAQAALDVLKLEQGIAESQAKQNESAEGVASAYRGRASAAREASQEAKAQSEEDKLQMQLAQGKLGIAQQQMELARSQTGHAREQKQILEDQSVVREKILDIQQETETSELNATNEAADRAGRLAIATAESKSNSEGMANAMGKAAESAGQTADAMGKAADAAGSAASAMSVDRKNPSSSSTTSSYANVDLADIAKRELELAAKIAEATGNTAQAQAIRDQIASENKKMELQALQDEANYLREQRELYRSERQRFIDQTIAVSKSFQRATGVPTLRNFEQEAATKAEKFFGGAGGIEDLSGGKSMQLLGQALQGFNPQIQQQQMIAQQQMGKAIESGNKEVGDKLDKINDTIGIAMSRPTEVNISGSEDIGGDVSKTLKALQIAQR